MNRTLKAYTELHSIYDYKRGLLQLLMTSDIGDDDQRKAEGDRLWELHIAKNYKERKYDTFEYPLFGINREKFDQVYATRSVSDWLMYYPTNFYNDFIKTVIELEQLTDRPISIKTLELHVNLFPYQFDDELKEGFIAHCTSAFKGLVTVKLIYVDPSASDALFYKQFNYVLKYDLLLGKESKLFTDTLKANPIPDTSFLIPDILITESKEFTGTNSDLIFSFSISLSTVVKLVPIKHQFYDYATE